MKTFGTVLNNKCVIDAINKINLRKKLLSISTFDSFTRYTNVNHDKLKFVSQELIKFYFKGGSGSILLSQNFKLDGLVTREITRLYLTKLSLS